MGGQYWMADRSETNNETGILGASILITPEILGASILETGAALKVTLHGAHNETETAFIKGGIVAREQALGTLLRLGFNLYSL